VEVYQMDGEFASLITNLQEKIDIAQEAVANVSDNQLKTIAFQVVLEKLLSTDGLPEFAEEFSPSTLPEPEGKEGKKSKQPTGPKGRVESLINEGFFNQKRTISEVKAALEARTWYHRQEDLQPSLMRLVQEKKLRRIKEPEKEGGKLIWRYSNW
jgi:hypothetical protein